MSTVQQNESILIIDFGSQYTQLIARRVRQLGVFSKIVRPDRLGDELTQQSLRGVILSGGPQSVLDEGSWRVPDAVWDVPCPILGICYGMQVMALQCGGQVVAGAVHEYGHAQVNVNPSHPLLAGLSDGPANEAPYLDVWMSHGDQVAVLPPEFVGGAATDAVKHVACMHKSRPWYGLQFHPEVTQTRSGEKILQRFIYDVCGCQKLWTSAHKIETLLEEIQQQVGDDHVLLALSGGVDSSVAAALLHRTIGDRLHCLFVDNGLLRHGEVEQVMTTLGAHLGVNIECIDAAQDFLQDLKGVTDPEAKRKRIGHRFIHVFAEASKRYTSTRWLAQGTIYPDVIESAAAGSTAEVIKSHHNVGGLPDDMPFDLLEPLRTLFKDEVREIGEALGLPHEMVYRHPFPGPGLGVRILGEVNEDYVSIVQQADHLFIQALREHNLYDEVSQAFAVLLPVKTVGVKGDARVYEYVIALRAVKTVDFMTAHWAHLPHDFLSQVSLDIINNVPHVARVVYDISGKPPATIEWE